MSGWDTSSRPSWEQPEGPEDSTQAFSAPDLGAGADDPWSAAATASPPPEFFPDYGQRQEPPRPSFDPEPELPRRGRHHAAASDAGYGQDVAYAQQTSYGQEAPYPQDPAYGRGMGRRAEVSAGPDAPYGQDTVYSPDAAYVQDTGAAPGQDPMTSQESARTGWNWVHPGGGPAGRAPWDDGPRQEPGQEPARSRFAALESRPSFDAPESRPGFDAPESRPAFDDPEPGYRGAGRPEPGRPDMRGDLDGRDAEAGRSGWGQPGPSGGPRDREEVARMDPALQDFFAPQPRPGVPPSGNGRRDPGAPQPRPGLGGTGPRPGLSREGLSREGLSREGLSRDGRPGPDRPGHGGLAGGRGNTAGNVRVPLTDGWPVVNGPRPRSDGRDAPVDAPAVPRRRADTRPPRPAPGRGTFVGEGRGPILVIAGVVAVIVLVVVGWMVLTRKPASSNAGAGSTPTLAAKTPAATKAATKPTASPAASGPVYTLSTPPTAGGYPIGQDPDFLATATTTAQSIVSSVSSGGGGTVQGSPVSASYQLPTDEQTMEFVGYQGTFNPAKVETILASLGSDPNSYPAGADGGILGCANTTSAPSGGVCVWATTSTLGVVEFFEGTGPETLVTAQAKGAAAVVSLRSGVETAKKS